VPFGLPGDQRLDQALGLTYTSAELTDDLHVLGRARLHLDVSTTATVLGFVATLSDVAPDGSTQLVAKGILNGTRRDSLAEPAPLEPGTRYSLSIELDCTAWLFRRGHSLRLALANADWPNVWPTPEPAVSTVYRDSSWLVLPTVPGAAAVESPSFEPAPTEPSRHLLAAEPPEWRIERDGLSRRAWLRYRFGGSERVSPHSVVERSFSFETQVDPDDPAQASARGHHTSVLHRPSGTVAAVSATSVRGSATHFLVTIEVEVRVDGVLHFTRSWAESIPRQLC
jgi:hypothetical protein